jgi:hypothetical protein
VTLVTETVRPWKLSSETVLRGNLVVLFGAGSLSFLEPSPYEIFFFVLIPVALIAGLTVTRVTLALFFIVFFLVASELTALAPYLVHYAIDGLTPLVYSVNTAYLYSSAVLFALIFSRHTKIRLEVSLRAFAFSAVFAAIWGILSYLNVGDFADREPIIGRVAGPFKDPNVLGSYCVLGALYLMHSIMLGSSRFRILKVVSLGTILFGGVFLSFSRGSWGAMIFSTVVMGISAFVTADNLEIRRKIIKGAVGIVFLVIAGVAVIATNQTLSSTFTDRAKLEQEYDGGPNGRFGNQMRSIPMLLDRPLGFGPYRYPVYFDIQPHNSYVNAFAASGWVGGCSFLLLVGTTVLLGLRLAFTHSPFLRHAQIVTPVVIAYFLQALQIDIDHWRFLFLLIGAVWGMEAARQCWAPAPNRLEPAPDPAPASALAA